MTAMMQLVIVTRSLLAWAATANAVRSWLDSWPGVGHVAVGMHRQGFDLQLTQYDDRGWCATFYTTGMEHSPTSATGTAWERTPWHATQRAAWDALKQADDGELSRTSDSRTRNEWSA